MPSHIDDRTRRSEDTADQLARLREQVDALIRDKVAPAVEGATEFVGEVAQDAMRGSARVLAGGVRAQPLAAILIAAALGFLLGRAGR